MGFFSGFGKAFKGIGKTVGKIGAGALGGFLTGGPLGALAGGAMGGFQKGGLNFKNALKGFGMGGLGGLGTSGMFGSAGLGSGLGGMFSGGGLGGGLMQNMGLPGLFRGGMGGGLDFTPGFNIKSMANNVLGTNFGGGGSSGANSMFGGGGGGGGLLSKLFGQGGIMGSGGIPGLASLILGTQGARQQQKRQSATGDTQRALLGQAGSIAGLSPEAKKQMLDRAREGIRSSQADRGVFTSGGGAREESEQMPMIEAHLNQLMLQNLLNTSNAYGGAY